MASLIKRNWKTGPAWYIQYCVANQQRRIHGSNNFQIAKETLRRFEAAKAAGDDLPLPTRTLIPDIIAAYVQHIRQIKTAKSAQTDVYYLRDMFGPVCDELKINSRKQSIKARKKPSKAGVNVRTKVPVIEADCMEAIRTAEYHVYLYPGCPSRPRPQDANRYREILMRLFNWAMERKNVRMPNDKNPAAKVERYKEPAPTIHFLTLKQIEEQLDALADQVKLQAMVATLIYAGLRREELLWLTHRYARYQIDVVRLVEVDGATKAAHSSWWWSTGRKDLSRVSAATSSKWIGR